MAIAVPCCSCKLFKLKMSIVRVDIDLISVVSPINFVGTYESTAFCDMGAYIVVFDK